jgi:hypothetical protein
MDKKNLVGMLFIFVVLAGLTLPVLALDTLVASDFTQESWTKTVDYYDYARAYALLHGIQTPPGFENWHAYMYMTYVNTRGLQVLYSGLINVSFGGSDTFSIPTQTVMMHFKTENHTRDVVMASNFLTLLAFNETSQSLYPNSPDRNDNLWASFTIGYNLTQNFPNVTFPAFHTGTSVIPLTHSADKLHWSWGMVYTNLTSIWWRMFISPENETYISRPVALVTYDELSFTYNLTIHPDTNEATLTENHVIGRIQDLWDFWGLHTTPMRPLRYTHYNSTGAYEHGTKLSNETVYDFIQKNQIKMSIVDYQTSVVADQSTVSKTATNQNATDNDVDVSNSSVSTYTADGERVYDMTFGTKQTYKLYNYTADPTETSYSVYNATARTAKIGGFAQNRDAQNNYLFDFHMRLMRFLPFLVANMQPQLVDRAEDQLCNMTRADYLYIIAYPVYDGYRIEHDPTTTVYLAVGAVPEIPNNPSSVATWILGISAASGVAALAIAVKRKSKNRGRSP